MKKNDFFRNYEEFSLGKKGPLPINLVDLTQVRNKNDWDRIFGNRKVSLRTGISSIISPFHSKETRRDTSINYAVFSPNYGGYLEIHFNDNKIPHSMGQIRDVSEFIQEQIKMNPFPKEESLEFWYKDSFDIYDMNTLDSCKHGIWYVPYKKNWKCFLEYSSYNPKLPEYLKGKLNEIGYDTDYLSYTFISESLKEYEFDHTYNPHISLKVTVDEMDVLRSFNDFYDFANVKLR